MYYSLYLNTYKFTDAFTWWSLAGLRVLAKCESGTDERGTSILRVNLHIEL